MKISLYLYKLSRYVSAIILRVRKTASTFIVLLN